MTINIIFENKDLLVIEKPVDVIVHLGAGDTGETIVDWLISKYPEIKKFDWPEKNRPGIVHRLDKDTSGLLILAKNPEALDKLQKGFQEHKIVKKYLALVLGKVDNKEGEIESFIGRDPDARRKQASTILNFDFLPGTKRFSKTRYKVVKHYCYKNNDLSLIEATLDTGRTHQIRVQFKSLGHPLIGDQTYNTKLGRHVSKDLDISRQFLHAFEFGFDNQHFKSELPNDLQNVLNKLS